MRTKQDHVRQCDYIHLPGLSETEKSHYSKVFGINRASILMELSDFDVTRNLPQDLMHVLLKGVFIYHMEQLFHYDIVVNESTFLTPIAVYLLSLTCTSVRSHRP
jgi:hypothetical protein